MGLANMQGKSIRNEPAKCFSTLPLLLYDSYCLLSPRNQHLPSPLPPTSRPVHPFVLCSDVFMPNHWKRLSWSVDSNCSIECNPQGCFRGPHDNRRYFWLLWKHNEKSLFVRTVTSPRVPTVIWFQPWLNVDSPQESWIVGIVCVLWMCFVFSVPFKPGISMLSLDCPFSLFRLKI